MQPRDTVAYLSDWKAKIDQGGGGGDNGDMELTDRVANLEKDMKDVRERLTRIETKIDHVATKDDVNKQHIDIQRWMIATIVGLFLGFGGLFLAMGNALKPAQQLQMQPQQPPIIINVPAAPPATPAK